jgi:hypothetical protein
MKQCPALVIPDLTRNDKTGGAAGMCFVKDH